MSEWYVLNTLTRQVAYHGTCFRCYKILNKYRKRPYKMVKYEEIPKNFFHIYHLNDLEKIYEKDATHSR